MYADSLKNEGLTPERAAAITGALDTLHAALAKLDRNSLKQFFSLPLETRLANYAQAEGLMDITSFK
jgi:hypothetical protein